MTCTFERCEIVLVSTMSGTPVELTARDVDEARIVIDRAEPCLVLVDLRVPCAALFLRELDQRGRDFGLVALGDEEMESCDRTCALPIAWEPLLVHARHRVRRSNEDSRITPLIPLFLEARASDVLTLRVALERGDFRAVRRMGHVMAGLGTSLGFRPISGIGAALERHAEREDLVAARRATDRLERYLRDVATTDARS